MGVALLWFGLVVYLIGVVWLCYQAWTSDQPLMAVGIFFLAPIFGLIYTISHWDEARVPFALVVVGFFMRIGGVVMTN